MRRPQLPRLEKTKRIFFTDFDIFLEWMFTPPSHSRHQWTSVQKDNNNRKKINDQRTVLCTLPTNFTGTSLIVTRRWSYETCFSNYVRFRAGPIGNKIIIENKSRRSGIEFNSKSLSNGRTFVVSTILIIQFPNSIGFSTFAIEIHDIPRPKIITISGFLP